MAVFGLLGYVFTQARMRAGAAAARLHSGPDDGGVPAPRDAAVQRDPLVLVTRPISATMLALALLALIAVLSPALQKTREVAFQEEE